VNRTGDRRDPQTVVWLRIAICGGLLVAALRPSWPGEWHRRPPLLVLDVSDSMGSSGVGAAGASGVAPDRLLFADGMRLALRGEEDAGLPRGRTRLREVLEQAGELLGGPPGVAWLWSDGLDTEGGALEGARALARRGHKLFVSAPQPVRADVGLLSARLDAAALHAPVAVRAQVVASAGGAARVALRRAQSTVDAVSVSLAPGVARDVVLRDPHPLEETTVYEVTLTPVDGTPDDDPENDHLALVAGTGEPLVLVMDAESWGALPGAPRIRSATSLDPAVVDVADLVVLSDVAWRRIREGGVDRLGRLVAGGASLLVLGGPDAFEAGGWRGTAFERLLPLRSPRHDADDTAIVVAVDRSGSTGEAPAGGAGTPLASLLRALAELVDALPAGVSAGVLPFAGTPDDALLAPGWVRGGDPVAAAAAARAARTLVAGGGTDIDEAIAGAARMLAAGPAAKQRRVLLLTDGDPDHTLTPSALSRAREALSAAGASFSAVVRGDVRAAEALRSLAAAPEDVTQIDEAGDFPEALLAAFHRGQAGGAWIAGPMLVDVRANAPELLPLAKVPPSRIHRVELAEGAMLLASARRAPGSAEPQGTWPLVATRSLGAGRVVAFAGGPALEVGPAREGLRAALAELLSRLAAEADRGLAGDEEGDRVAVRAPEGLGALSLYGSTSPQASTLVEVSPGTYAGPRPPGVPGDEPLLVEGSGFSRRPVRMPARPAIEHRAVGVDAALLDALAVAGGGTRVPPGAEPPVAMDRARHELAPWILLACLVLFVLERAPRRPRRSSERPHSLSSPLDPA